MEMRNADRVEKELDVLKRLEKPVFQGEIESEYVLGRLAKRIVRRLILWLLIPFEQRINAALNQQTHLAEAFMAEIQDILFQIHSLEEQAEAIQGQDAFLEEQMELLKQQAAANREQIGSLQGQFQQQQALQKQTEKEMQRQIDILCGQLSLQQNLADQTEKQFQNQLDILEKKTYRQRKLSGQVQKDVQEQGRKLSAIARDTIRTKWSFIDHCGKENTGKKHVLECRICGFQAEEGIFQTVESDCIFDGGHLKRYVCPECGVIFGPVKFSNLAPDEIDDDYTVHYTGHHEGDSTEKELRAFYLLQPEKDRVYLDYGCGCWSHALQQVQAEGYTVYGYEPYAPDLTNPLMISDQDKLMRMRFDGIFSNDLLEHLINPVEDMRFMKSLLKCPDSKISHSTSCYIYKHEYTRFHTHFFTGRSVQVLSERAGLRVVNMVNDEKEHDFICCIYALANSDVDYLPIMLWQGDAIRTPEGWIQAHPDGIVCGPCIQLAAGMYHFILEIEPEDETAAMKCSVTASLGKEKISELPLRAGANQLSVTLATPKEMVELVIRNDSPTPFLIKRLEMVPEF